MFVDRNNGQVTAVFALRQYEGQEELPGDHPDLLVRAFGETKRARLLQVAAELNRRMAAGFVYKAKTYQLDEASQNRITALALKAYLAAAVRPGATWDANFAFIAADNEAVPFAAADFGAFADAASNIVIARRYRARALKDEILAATTPENLAAIDITIGW